MVSSRSIDRMEISLVNQGKALFQVCGAGHEGSAILAQHLQPADYLHLHYRDKALMLAHGVPISQFFHSLLCTEASHSQGRQMSAHLSAPKQHTLSIVGPVGNHALQAAGIARSLKERRIQGIVICSLGDGTSQQGEVLESIAEAVRSKLPVLFWISDNQLSISTKTAGQTFFSRPEGPGQEFYGLPIHRLDGRHVHEADGQIASILASTRHESKPSLILSRVERLSDHTNADDERTYRTSDHIHRAHAEGDPITNLAKWLMDRGVEPEQLRRIEKEAQAEVAQAAGEAQRTPGSKTCVATKRELHPCESAGRGDFSAECSSGLRPTLNPPTSVRPSEPSVTMAQAIQCVLQRWLSQDPRVCVLGQDIEDPKGDVFGVTRGLSTQFPGRVCNAPLSESTIVGVSVGRALAGDRPVAMLQFADFVPLALNQIISEMATMYWRTAGGWECPVILMAPCGGYRPGLGPFHAQSFESLLAQIPGLDVLIPSNAVDAARLLNGAFEARRPTVFFYPKALLHERFDPGAGFSLHESELPGGVRRWAGGDDLTMVAWGNTVGLCRKAGGSLERAGFGVDLIDLHSLSPWDQGTLLTSVRRTRQLLVVHEENLTGGFGAEILATVAEKAGCPVKVRRMARPDTFIPCNYANQLELLPSVKGILSAAADLLEVHLSWPAEEQQTSGLVSIRARGASPADRELKVVQWQVRVGQRVEAGDLVAELESDKAVCNLESPVAGIVRRLLVSEGVPVEVDTPVVQLEVGGETASPGTMDETIAAAEPVFVRPPLPETSEQQFQVASGFARNGSHRVERTVHLTVPVAVTGSEHLTNELLATRFPGRSAEEIGHLSGMATRCRVGSLESGISLAIAAVQQAMDSAGLSVAELDAIICHTSTPGAVSPSMACQIQAALPHQGQPKPLTAYDLHAACSGFIYGLQAAFDFVTARPGSTVLLVTAEEMSRVIDPSDFDTAILFGDAATATIVSDRKLSAGRGFTVERPIALASPDHRQALSVPNPGTGFVSMRGREVFSEAIRKMLRSLELACGEAKLQLSDLDHIVPHQANGRIIEALRTKLGPIGGRVRNTVHRHGNTSSSSIPLCLKEEISTMECGERVGICAFGGGFTWGGAVLEVVSES